MFQQLSQLGRCVCVSVRMNEGWNEIRKEMKIKIMVGEKKGKQGRV